MSEALCPLVNIKSISVTITDESYLALSPGGYSLGLVPKPHSLIINNSNRAMAANALMALQPGREPRKTEFSMSTCLLCEPGNSLVKLFDLLPSADIASTGRAERGHSPGSSTGPRVSNLNPGGFSSSEITSYDWRTVIL